MSTWNPNVPSNLQELLETSAPIVRNNFNSIGNAYGTDHVPLGSTVNKGEHNQVTLVTKSADPTPDATNGRIFSKVADGAAAPLAHWQDSAADGGNSYPLSSNGNYITPYTISGTVVNITEFSAILGNVILKHGTIETTSVYAGSFTVQYGGPTTPNPFPNAVSFVGFTPSALKGIGQNVIQITNSTVSGFTVTVNSPGIAAGTLGYIAWGS